jgi:hypothetical protein
VNVVAEMLLNEPAPVAIWAALMILTLPALLMLGSPHGVRSPRRALRDIVDVLRERGDRRRRQDEEAASAARYADEVRAAADRASVAADRWQEIWEQAEQDRETAWHAWLDADERLRAARAAAAFGTPWTAQTPTEYAARERFLHRAVAAAAAAGELPAAAVADALAGRNGWDARLHPLEQELAIRRAAAAHSRAAYEASVRTELSTRHDAELAARARESLRREAADALALRHAIPLPHEPVALAPRAALAHA